MIFRRVNVVKKCSSLLLVTGIIFIGYFGVFNFHLADVAIDHPSVASVAMTTEESTRTANTTYGRLVLEMAATSASVEFVKNRKHKSTLITSTPCGQEYFLLILVASATYNYERRRDIRVTWGVDYAIKPRWKTMFLVGKPRTEKNATRLATEEKIFGDFVRGGYYDHYWNQTRKVQMAFEWAHKYCNFSYLLKVDDDVFVDIKGLVSHLSKPTTPRTKYYMGDRIRNPIVFRQGKWRVTEEEFSSGKSYPDFVRGLGYVLSPDVVSVFVDLFGVVRHFRLDDVYVGMLADKAGVEITHHPGFLVFGPKSFAECVLPKDILLWHGVVGHCLFKIQEQMLEREKNETSILKIELN